METKPTPLLIYGLYANAISQIKHFDNLQTYFRTLASSFSLGAFAAFGFLLSSDNIADPFQNLLPITTVMIIGIATVLAMWDLDLVFYERLQSSNLAEAIKLEKTHHWLPQIHSESIYRHRHDKPSIVLFFYLGSVGALVITSTILLIYLLNSHGLWIKSLVAGAACLFLVLIYLWMLRHTANTRKQVDILVHNVQPH